MYSSKKTKFLNILCIVLALSPGLIRLTRHHFPNVSSNSLICVLYITAALIWLTQLQLRLLRKEERYRDLQIHRDLYGKERIVSACSSEP